MRTQLAALRKQIAESAGFPAIVSTDLNPKSLAFARATNIREISQRGPATPDHILRTKRLPMLGRDAAEYAAAYREYFARNAPHAKESKTMLDPAPRVILDPEFGLTTVGRSSKEAAIARDLYAHTIDVIGRAEALGGYRALSEEELFEFEAAPCSCASGVRRRDRVCDRRGFWDRESVRGIVAETRRSGRRSRH
jgi:rhamnose utilization protein RhaD (predicted bifunctional aldolase and dehydrogenase)